MLVLDARPLAADGFRHGGRKRRSPSGGREPGSRDELRPLGPVRLSKRPVEDKRRYVCCLMAEHFSQSGPRRATQRWVQRDAPLLGRAATEAAANARVERDGNRALQSGQAPNRRPLSDQVLRLAGTVCAFTHGLPPAPPANGGQSLDRWVRAAASAVPRAWPRRAPSARGTWALRRSPPGGTR